MRSPVHHFGLLSLAALGVVASVLSCGSDEGAATACESGVFEACTGDDGCPGLAQCASDGSGFGACACDVTGAGGAGAMGGSSGAGGGGMAGSASMAGAAGGGSMTGGAGGASMGPVRYDRAVGGSCLSDTDCPAELICVAEGQSGAFGDNGPARGYCSLPCRSATDCSVYDALSLCGLRGDDGNGFCLAQCGYGGVASDGRVPLKCEQGGERLQACAPLSQTVSACVPRCAADSDCGQGRFCDLGDSGLCVDSAPVGGAIGAACTPATAATDCASRICEVVDGQGFCSAACTFGNIAGCGFAADASARDAACLDTITPAGDAGDFGICFELCDTAADCEQGDFVCEALPAGNQAAFGRTGLCLPAL